MKNRRIPTFTSRWAYDPSPDCWRYDPSPDCWKKDPPKTNCRRSSRLDFLAKHVRIDRPMADVVFHETPWTMFLLKQGVGVKLKLEVCPTFYPNGCGEPKTETSFRFGRC